MKNLLTLFLVVFIFSSNFSFFSSIALKSSNKKSGLQQSTVNLGSLPNFNNLGFKCMKVITKPNDPDLCGEQCKSKGLIMIETNREKKQFLFIKVEQNKTVGCNAKDLEISATSIPAGVNPRCFTMKLNEAQTFAANATIPINYFYQRVCSHEAVKGTLKYVKHNETLDCKAQNFSDNEKADGKCECINVLIPNDNLEPIYFPTRISNNEIQCLQVKSSFCDGYLSESACSAQLAGKIDSQFIKRAPVGLNDNAHKFFFNRWICPSESGLQTAVKYNKESTESSYSVSCLGRTGEDCFYGDNANEVCKRVNECPDAIREFKFLQCASEGFKKTWGHSGFDTPLNSWCREATAWLRFDGQISINEKSKVGLTITSNGANACLADPNKPSSCLINTEQKILEAQINSLKSDGSKLGTSIIQCNEKMYPDARLDQNHFCAKSIIQPDSKGRFEIGLKNLETAVLNP